MDFSAASSKIVRPNFFLSRGFLSAPAFFLFLAVALAFAPGARASITYDMTNYPSSQPDSQEGNYTVSGTITTDGATVLSNSDIQSYLISITDPTTQYSFVLSNTNSTLTAVGLQANATSLYLLQGGNNFLEINDSSNSAELLYRDSLPEEGGPPQYSYKTSLGTLWSADPVSGGSNPGAAIGTDPMTIAGPAVAGSTVPEPTTLTVWSLLGLAGAVYLRPRKAKV
jgi:hypothetical protein